tara:strand:+ start:893 stop:2005 length:1113 start_codon:yes stop_codon:yes gene_type:complete
MHIAFVTFGNYLRHPTLKRATGMAGPLMKKGHKVSILIEDSPDNRDKVKKECPQADVFFHQRGKSACLERAEKQKTLDEIKPDVVWICGVGLRNWVRRPVSSCVVIGDHSELVSSFIPKGPRCLYEYLCEWLHLWSFDAHICASRYLEEFYLKRLRRVGKRIPVHYSPYAFDTDLVHSERAILEELRVRCSRPKTIVYMGSLWENYGCWDMLHVFRDLMQQRNDFQVFMIGKGPELEKARIWIRDEQIEDRCHLEGYAPEEHLSSYFEMADVFVCPLRNTIQDWARCPSKLYMYLPFRKPVITSAIGEAAQLFGEQGNFYEPGNRIALLESIQNILDVEHQQKTYPDPAAHNYESRTDAFLNWFEGNWPK